MLDKSQGATAGLVWEHKQEQAGFPCMLPVLEDRSQEGHLQQHLHTHRFSFTVLGKQEMLDAGYSHTRQGKIFLAAVTHLFLNSCICFLSLPVIFICFKRRLQIRRKPLVN